MIHKHILSRFRPGGIGRNISWLLLHSGVEVITMTLASLLVARLFGPASLGQLAIILAGVQLVTLLADGFFPTIIKHVSEARVLDNPDAALIGWRLVWVSVTTLLAAAILTGAVAYYFYQTHLTLVLVLLAIMLAVARGWRPVIEACFRGLEEFRTPAFIGSVCAALMAGSIIWLAAAGYKVTMYVGVMVAGMMVNCIFLTWAYRRRYLQSDRVLVHTNVVPTSEFLRYSMPLAFRGISTFFLLNINVLILGGVSSFSDVGQFRLTNQFLVIPSLVLSSVLAAVAPRVAAAHLGGKPQLELFLSRVYGLMLIITIPLALFFLFNAPLLNLAFPDYAPASRMLSFFAPSMALMGLAYAASIIPVQAGKPGLAFMITLISGVTNVVAAYVGLKAYGVTGLAVATATVHFSMYLAGIVITHRAFGIRFRIRFS